MAFRRPLVIVAGQVQRIQAGDLIDPAFLPSTASVLTGKIIYVDSVNGDDGTGIRGDFQKPFLTIAAALAVALAGDLVYARPGAYTLASGITLPADVTLSGLSSKLVTLQMIGVAANTTLVTMGLGSRLENVMLNLTSTGAFSLTGILFPSTTSNSAVARNVDIDVTRTTSTGAQTIAGVLVQSTGTLAREFRNLVNCKIVVASTGTGTNRGLLMNTSVGNFNVTDCAFKCTGSGSTIGAEVNIASASLFIQGGSSEGTTAAISQTAGTLNISQLILVNNNANGLSFSVSSDESSFMYGHKSSLGTGEYLVPGYGDKSSLQLNTRVQRSGVLRGITARAITAPGAGKSTTYTVLKNGVATTLAVTLANTTTSNADTANSVSVAAGDDISVQATVSGGSAADVSVAIGFY